MTSARYGFRSKRQKSSGGDSTIDKQKVLTRVRRENYKSASPANEQDAETNSVSVDTVPGSISDSDKISYPSLDSISSDEASGLLYPALTDTGSTTPTTRRLVSAVTERKQRNDYNDSLQVESGMITPSLTGTSSIPRDSNFEFKPTAAIQEAGKKILEGLKLSSAAVKAQMKSEFPLKASPLAPPKTPLKTMRKHRFSDIHQKLFSNMDNIASHYSVRKTKSAMTDTKSLYKTPNPLKRKAPEPLTSAFKSPLSPQVPLTLGGNDDQDSPFPARKRVKADMQTPAVTKSVKVAKFANIKDTPDKPLKACHLHGLSRSVSVKQGIKRSLVPKSVDVEASPITPPKPVAIPSPMKASTLLASPIKDRAPATVISKPSAPGTPSPVKTLTPINVDQFMFRHPSRLPKLIPATGLTATEMLTRQTNSADPALFIEGVSPRILFRNEAAKRKAEHLEDLFTSSTKSKRVCLGEPKLPSPIFQQSEKTNSPIKCSVRKSKLDLLATPKIRAVPKAIGAGTPSKPRWR